VLSEVFFFAIGGLPSENNPNKSRAGTKLFPRREGKLSRQVSSEGKGGAVVESIIYSAMIEFTLYVYCAYTRRPKYCLRIHIIYTGEHFKSLRNVFLSIYIYIYILCRARVIDNGQTFNTNTSYWVRRTRVLYCPIKFINTLILLSPV